jgi:hypothetical protein
VPFHIGSTEGLVIYMARKSADFTKLVSITNEEHLTYSTLLIGSAYALRRPRLEAERERRLENDQAMHRVKMKMKTLHAMHQDLQTFVSKESERKHLQQASTGSEDRGGDPTHNNEADQVCCSCCHRTLNQWNRKVTSSYRKFFGAQTAPP